MLGGMLVDLRCNFLKTIVDVRLKIQPALKVSSLRAANKHNPKLLPRLTCLTMKRKKKAIFEDFGV